MILFELLTSLAASLTSLVRNIDWARTFDALFIAVLLFSVVFIVGFFHFLGKASLNVTVSLLAIGLAIAFGFYCEVALISYIIGVAWSFVSHA